VSGETYPALAIEQLRGGSRTHAIRLGEVVLRPVAPWTPTVLALLRHLEEAGYSASPRVVGDGYDGAGHEVLAYVEGTSPHPRAWSDDAVTKVGELMRGFHDAAATFPVPAGAVWQPWYFRSAGPDAIIGHCDTGPWNIVAKDGMPVALIDWEYAGPTDRWDDIAQAAWLNAQLHDDDIAERYQLPAPDVRARQLRLFLDGYSLSRTERQGFVDRLISYAIRDSAKEAIDTGVTPETTDPTPLWAISWRARSAAWMLRKRPLLQAALDH
jgi:hypothetical protein